MTRRQRRMIFVAAAFSVVSFAAFLVVFALGDAAVYFYTPSEAKAKNVPPAQVFNLGGLVKDGSVKRQDGIETLFQVTDGQMHVDVTYSKDLPDLFREGQGVVATGHFRDDGVFEASNVLAKHDETYMPPEVARAMKEKRVWREPSAKEQP